VVRTVEAGRNPETVIRLIVTRGEGTVSLAPEPELKPNLVIIVRHHEPLPESAYLDGVEAALVTTERNAPGALDPNIKSGNYLNNVLAIREAAATGAFEALMLDHAGRLTEATSSNVFLVRSGRLVTPHERVGLLRGITRELVLRLAASLALAVDLRDVPAVDLTGADEVFLTSTLKEVLPVSRLNGRPVGDGKVGPITRSLLKAFRELVERFKATGAEPEV
jgi:branched-chain amino acid aminotransferase